MTNRDDFAGNVNTQSDANQGASNKSTYFWSGGKRYSLVIDPELIAVRMKPSRETLSISARNLLDTISQPTLFIPEYGVQVSKVSAERAFAQVMSFRSKSERPEVEQVRLSPEDVVSQATTMLNGESAIDFASPVYRRTSDSPEIIVPTKQFLVQFKPEVTRPQINALNSQYGVEIVEPLDYAQNGYLLTLSPDNSEQNAISIANAYFESDLTIFSHPNLIQQRVSKRKSVTQSRSKSSEPGVLDRGISEVRESVTATNVIYLNKQWHLAVGKVRDAWKTTRGNPSIKIAILDDGVDIDHPEFSSKVASVYDFARNNDTMQLGQNDNHGTACAGIALAAGIKSAGVAPMCSLIAARTPRYLGSADEARMFIWAAESGADVISCSWGPLDGTGHEDPIPDNVKQAIHECVRYGGRGRNGKGIPIFWAAGNGNESVSLDGYASNPDVIAVAASTSNENIAWYSDSGKEISICAPSSGDPAQGDLDIFSVDRVGPLGFNSGSTALGDIDGDYTNDFGGTSAAAPLVAGVAALMLSIYPELTAMQVRDILQRTADKIGEPQSYVGGFSPHFGYGRVNAQEAVQLALSLAQSIPGASIKTDAVVARSATTLTFRLNLPLDKYYAIELADNITLFDLNSNQRTDSNYYASWLSSGLFREVTYELPENIWAQLKTANKLYYRVWLSDASDHWINIQVIPPLANTSDILFVTIVEQENKRRSSTPKPKPTRKHITNRSTQSARTKNSQEMSMNFITGPQVYSRISEPPTFTIMTDKCSCWVVEIATDPDLFDDAQGATERNPTNYFTSVNHGLEHSDKRSSTYTLPSEAWMKLRPAARLYYRLIILPSSKVNRDGPFVATLQESNIIELHNPSS